MYFCYIIRCNNNSLYIGSTNNLTKRELEHNQGNASVYTKNRLPIKIIYSESFKTRTEAVQRERQIKRWTRLKKENLIKYGHPNPNKL